MSCVHWASWAAKKAAQIVGESGGSGSTGGGLPVVELLTVFSIENVGEAIALTSDESKAIEAVIGSPFVLKYPLNFSGAVCEMISYPNQQMVEYQGVKVVSFYITFGQFHWLIQGLDGNWSVTYHGAFSVDV